MIGKWFLIFLTYSVVTTWTYSSLLLLQLQFRTYIIIMVELQYGLMSVLSLWGWNAIAMYPYSFWSTRKKYRPILLGSIQYCDYTVFRCMIRFLGSSHSKLGQSRHTPFYYNCTFPDLKCLTIITLLSVVIIIH